MKKIIPKWLAWIMFSWTAFTVIISSLFDLFNLAILDILVVDIPAAIIVYMAYYYLK